MSEKIKFNPLSGKFDLVSNIDSLVTGPASATDNAICRFDLTTGKIIQDSVVIISDTGAMTGILSAAIGSGTITTITGTQISASAALTIVAVSGDLLLNSTAGSVNINSLNDITITATGTNKNITLTPTGTGLARVSYLSDKSILFANGTGISQDNTHFIYSSSNGIVATGTNIISYLIDTAATNSRLFLWNMETDPPASTPYTVGSSITSIIASNDPDRGVFIDLGKSRGQTNASPSQTLSGDAIAEIRFLGFSDVALTGYEIVASIECRADGNTRTSRAPGRLIFKTCALASLVNTTRLIIDSSGTFTFTGGGTITSSSVGSGWTQWNVDNLRLDLNTLSSTDTNGNINLTPNGTGSVVLVGVTVSSASAVSGLTKLDVDNIEIDGNSILSTNTNGNITLDANGTGNIIFSDSTQHGTTSAQFGSTNQAAISYSTNLIINPAVSGTGYVFIGDGTTQADLRAKHLGIGDAAPAAARMINMNESSAAVTNGIFTTLTYTGSGNTVRAMNMTITYSGSNTSPQALSAFVATHTVDSSGSLQIYGALGQASAGVASTQGTKRYAGLRGTVSDGGFTHTGGTIYVASIHAIASSVFAGGATVVVWGGLFEDDLQVVSDKKLILEGSTTVKGDSYLIYNSGTTDMDVFVDGTKSTTFDADKLVPHVDLKLDTAGTGIYLKEGTNCHMGVATLVAGTVTVSTTKAVTGVRIFLSRFTNGGTLGILSYTIATGTSFTITSNNILDTSVVNWLIISQA